MSPQHKKQSKAQQGLRRSLLIILSTMITLTILFSSVAVIETFFDNGSGGLTGNASDTNTVSEPEEEPKITKLSTATVAVTGDLLMHEPIITNSKFSDGYNFDLIYKYFGEYASKADYAVANLETTLRGNQDGYKYTGYPRFNCPDEIIKATKSAGFDMLLTANNHSYDTWLQGMLRTLDVVDENGIDHIGTVKDEAEKRYKVVDVNGIKIGMICYTYETNNEVGKVALNGIPMKDEAKNLVNAFSYGELDAFYEKIEQQIAEMKQDGAESTVLYIHWGNEYQITENKYQNQIAQKLCNFGIDVIVGGHPHVIQPVELLTSETDSEHKTVCIYSVGNAVSNQRKERMNLKTGHTEDGVLFQFTFAKYNDGTVRLEGCDLLPTWVNMFYSSSVGKKVYQIIPLDIEKEDWKAAFDLSNSSESNARKSYNRTQKIVGEGMSTIKEYLGTLPQIEGLKLSEISNQANAA